MEPDKFDPIEKRMETMMTIIDTAIVSATTTQIS